MINFHILFVIALIKAQYFYKCNRKNKKDKLQLEDSLFSTKVQPTLSRTNLLFLC